MNTKKNIDFINKIKNATTKKFFLNIEYHKLFNPSFPHEYFTPQWQNITNDIPPIPLLFEWDYVPQVTRI